MAAPTTVPEVTPAGKHHTANGATLNFSYNFAIETPGDIVVFLDDTQQIYQTHYWLTGVGSTAGGEVQFTFYPWDGAKVTILRAQDIQQAVNLLANSSYSPSTIAAMHNRHTAVDQMLAERIGRAPKFAASSTTKDVVFPQYAASTYVGWSATQTDILENKAAPIPSANIVLSNSLPRRMSDPRISGTSNEVSRADHRHGIDAVYNVKELGVIGNGIADDTAAIQAIVDALPATGGMIFFPPGIYLTSDQLTIGDGTDATASAKNCIRLIGSGHSAVTAVSAATIIRRVGSSINPLIQVNGPIQGVEIAHMTLDCATIANTGITALSMRGCSFHDVSFYDYNFVGLYIYTTALDGTFNSSFRDLTLASLEHNPTFGIFLDGNAGALTDTTLCTFDTILIYYHGGVNSYGVYLKFCDQNFFRNLHITGPGNTGGAEIAFDGTSVAGFPVSNTFYGTGLYPNGISAFGNYGENAFYGYDTGNGSPVPTVQRISGITHANKFFGLWDAWAKANTTNQTIANNSVLTVDPLTQVFDTYDMFNPAAPSGIFAPVDGKYRVSASITWASNSTGIRGLFIYKSTVATTLQDQRAAIGVTVNTLSGVITMTAGQYVTLEVYQNSGGDLVLSYAELTLELCP